jgi:hypothetical protein
MECNCGKKLIWQSDFMCDEVFGCGCSEGLVGYWYCEACEKLFTYMTNCKSLVIDTLEEIKEEL